MHLPRSHCDCQCTTTNTHCAIGCLDTHYRIIIDILCDYVDDLWCSNIGTARTCFAAMLFTISGCIKRVIIHDVDDYLITINDRCGVCCDTIRCIMQCSAHAGNSLTLGKIYQLYDVVLHHFPRTHQH